MLARAVVLASILALLAAGAEARARKRPDPKPEDLLVVDCLLPGQVRSLGERTTYVTRRRPTRTTAQECRVRGGEYTAYDRADLATSLAVWLEGAQAGDAVAQLRV